MIGCALDKEFHINSYRLNIALELNYVCLLTGFVRLESKVYARCRSDVPEFEGDILASVKPEVPVLILSSFSVYYITVLVFCGHFQCRLRYVYSTIWHAVPGVTR